MGVSLFSICMHSEVKTFAYIDAANLHKGNDSCWKSPLNKKSPGTDGTEQGSLSW